MKFLCHAWTFESTCLFYKKDETVLRKVFEVNNIQDAFELALDWIRKYYRENTKSGYTFFAELKTIEPDIGKVMEMYFVSLPILLDSDSERLLLKGAARGDQPIAKSGQKEKSKFSELTANEQIRKLLKPINCFVSVAKRIYYVLRFLSKKENKSVDQIVKEALGLYVKERKEEFGEELVRFIEKS